MMSYSFLPKIQLRKSVSLVFALLLLCLCAALTCAQGQEDGEKITVNTSLVQLNVGVVDRQGRPITNLSGSDFVVYENDKQQSIVDFKPTTAPFSLVLLLDMSGSTVNFRQNLKQAALRFLDALSPEDRVSVVIFNEKVKALTGFTTDRRKAAYAILELADTLRGETQLYKALNFSLEHLAKEGARRKAVIVLTDGLDTEMRNQDRAAVARAQTNEEAIASIKPDASAPLNAVLNVADRQGVTIYPLALPSGDINHLPLPDPQLIGMYASARSRMQILADRTGGHISEIQRLDNLARLYAEIAAELRTLYSIAYQPAGSQRDGRWRTIRIEVARPELIARTRPGYFAR
ncbi:MAG: VWA domain-containing protein [Pyrinomonadaceae bacterium]